MKTLKSCILGICVAGFVVLLSSVSFAEAEDHQIDLALVKKGVIALQTTHPDLAARLLKYGDEEAKDELDQKDTKSENEGAVEKEDKEVDVSDASAIQLFKDAAAALQTTHPELAAGFTKYAGKEAKEDLNEKNGKEDSEKDEANETKDKK